MHITMIILLILGVLVSGCATTQGITGEDHYGPVHMIRDVPFYPQEDYQCGPASLAGVMNYWGIPDTPDDIAKAIYSRSARGTLTIDMVLYAQARGLHASHYAGSLDDLRRKIDSGSPLIVLVDYGFSIMQTNHFMVVIGYRDQAVIANSGRHEKKVISVQDFLKSWEKTKYWTLLIQRNE
jgi:predicted double-glycine peptidase